MFVADPLYGPILIPDRFTRLLRTPEVQRLREVRLLNTTTPSLASVSDVRRFTHTLGVLHLALRAKERLKWKWSSTALDTLIVAAIVHDVASPAFAHLFEYLLNSKYGFTHEAMLKSVIGGEYNRTNLYHQVYYGSQLQLHDCIEQLNVDCTDVVNYVTGQAPLASILAGTLDLDNLDNVYRMAQNLGLKADSQSVIDLIDQLDVDEDHGHLIVSQKGLPQINEWRRLRRKSYEIIAFDEQALASQAMLTDCLADAVDQNVLTPEHWFLTDEQMLRTLINLNAHVSVSLRETIMRFATADYYSTIFIGWYLKPKGHYDLRLPENRALLRERLEQALGLPISPYIFYDKGTFEKELNLQMADQLAGRDTVTIGRTSMSTIVSIFTSQRVTRVSRRTKDQVHEVLADFGLPRDSLIPIPDKQDVYGRSGNTQLAL